MRPSAKAMQPLNSIFDRRPILVALAGPNGAGKTSFYEANLRPAGLRLVNADLIALQLGLGAYEAVRVAGSIRQELVAQRESFVYETVFSDPAGDKLLFLKHAVAEGFTVVLCFIGLTDSMTSEQRVALRVTKGGHDVPTDKVHARFPRILSNLAAALRELPYVHVYDNSFLEDPYRLVAFAEKGEVVIVSRPVPDWLQSTLDL